MIEESLFTKMQLLGDAYYKLVPASPTYPALVISLVNENGEPALDCAADYVQVDSLFQVSIYGEGIESATAIKTIARTIQTLYNGFVGTFGSHEVTNMVVSLVSEDYDEKHEVFESIVEIRIYQ